MSVDEDLVLKARDVHWDWQGLPPHWFGSDPFLTHWANVMNMLLPEGEIWFVKVFRQALPLIRDDRLHEAVTGFIGQEAMHSTSHQSVLEHFDRDGFDTGPFTRQLSWFFEGLLGDRALTGRAERRWLLERVALVAAIEHVTSFLGDWLLNARALDDYGIDPTMLDLFRWHGAEEVEHRSVAFDLFTHLDGGYARRVRTHLLAYPALFFWWIRGLKFLLAIDKETDAKPRLRDWFRRSRKGLMPGPLSVAKAFFTYLRPSYHPSRYGSTDQAVAYLAASPAARAAG
ncbi:metal-dependent hydrolase [Amycolatopsis acidicola]|uniref:Metal-dependent hydrolase n=1 Tax=Amycolatopsis acidicola TaxID=2596893 RepID=A0A5N0UUV6_9PSEU|nr:metal-dependent hydrolase [Amycolatopsis acidicola]KAA9154192.1 metal-dependent hydrolase [Amycolatopsis acidicola]